MKQRRVPVIEIDDPCDICLVRPTCHVACKDLRKFIYHIWHEYTHYNNNAWVRVLRELVEYVKVEYPDLHRKLNIALTPGSRKGLTTNLRNMTVNITSSGQVWQSNTQSGVGAEL